MKSWFSHVVTIMAVAIVACVIGGLVVLGCVLISGFLGPRYGEEWALAGGVAFIVITASVIFGTISWLED